MSAVTTLPVSVLKVARMFAVVFALLMLFAVMPAPAHAAALTEVQTQAVINLLASFGADQTTLSNVSLALRGASRDDVMKALGVSSTTPKDHPKEQGDNMPRIKSEFPGASACGLLQRALGRGSNGDDVMQLQNFLHMTGDFVNASTTGFFGPATERALQEWQARVGVVKDGDAATTGFGALGPKTRGMIMVHCKEMQDGRPSMGTSTNPMSGGAYGTNDATTTPSCTLTANKTSIQAGETIELVWNSKNALYASSVGGGQGPVHGMIRVSPTETMTYLKHVYNNVGQGDCTITIMVGDDVTPAAEKKVVIVPTTIQMGHVISLMGSGMAAVMDGYLSLFGMSLE